MTDLDSLTRVVERLDPRCKLLDFCPLAGGVSAQVTALIAERPDGGRQTMVLRRHGEADLGGNPNIATDEFRLLQLLRPTGVAAPAPIFLDPSCEIFPTPYLVIEFVAGESGLSVQDNTALAEMMAEQLAEIHKLAGLDKKLGFLPWRMTGFGERSYVLDASLSEDEIRDALEAHGPPQRCNALALLHGDYWPGNVLWLDGRISAVIDWEDACVGDPLADVANARFELHWLVGADAAERFTQRYLALTDIDIVDLGYWDLCAALRPASKLDTWGIVDEQVQSMRVAHRQFVEQAFALL